MANKSTFYMVYAEGQSSPTKKYSHMGDAKKEAKRLCKELGVECYVMAAFYSCEVREFVEHEYDDLPF